MCELNKLGRIRCKFVDTQSKVSERCKVSKRFIREARTHLSISQDVNACTLLILCRVRTSRPGKEVRGRRTKGSSERIKQRELKAATNEYDFRFEWLRV